MGDLFLLFLGGGHNNLVINEAKIVINKSLLGHLFLFLPISHKKVAFAHNDLG